MAISDQTDFFSQIFYIMIYEMYKFEGLNLGCGPGYGPHRWRLEKTSIVGEGYRFFNHFLHCCPSPTKHAKEKK